MNYPQWLRTQPIPNGVVTSNGGPIGSEFYGAFVSLAVAGKIEESLTRDGIPFTRTFLETVKPNPGESRFAFNWKIGGEDYQAGQLLSQMWQVQVDGTGKWVSESPLVFKADPLPAVQPPPAPVRPPAPAGYHWVTGLMGDTLAKDATLGLTDAQKSGILTLVARALEGQ